MQFDVEFYVVDFALYFNDCKEFGACGLLEKRAYGSKNGNLFPMLFTALTVYICSFLTNFYDSPFEFRKRLNANF